MSSLVTDIETFDSQIIEEETRELKTLTRENAKRKSELIILAAKKLEEKYEDHSVIASRLTKLWSDVDIHPDTIQKALPEKYKRKYQKPEPVPESELQFFFKRLNELHKSAAKLCMVYSNRLQQDSELDKQLSKIIPELYKSMMCDTAGECREQFKKIIDMKTLINSLVDIELEFDAIRSMLDERQKFCMAWKFNLKILMVVKSFNFLSSRFIGSKKNGAKWLSKMDSDKNINRLFEAEYKCPKCDWDGSLYYEKLVLAQKRGRKIPDI